MPILQAGMRRTSTQPARVLPLPIPPTNKRNRAAFCQNWRCGSVADRWIRRIIAGLTGLGFATDIHLEWLNRSWSIGCFQTQILGAPLLNFQDAIDCRPFAFQRLVDNGFLEPIEQVKF